MWLFCGFLRVVRFQAFHCRDLMLWCRMAVPLGDGDRRMSHEFPQRHEVHSRHCHACPVGVPEIVQPEIETETLAKLFMASHDHLVVCQSFEELSLLPEPAQS